MFSDQNMHFTFLAVLALAAVYFFFIRPRLVRKKPEPYSAPLNTSVEVPNDKLIVVSDMGREELEEALKDFTSLYNGEDVVVYSRLVVANDGRLAVTFPYDIAFEPFGSMINYLVYAPEVTTEPIAIGWGTFAEADRVLPTEALGKALMVFVPEEEENHDQLFLVTSENLGYHLPLFHPKKFTTYPEPEEPYLQPPFDAARVDDWAKVKVEIGGSGT